ncbi:MAG: hypothetical protein NVS2B6_17250 [Thermoleophilaceae bacterium]
MSLRGRLLLLLLGLTAAGLVTLAAITYAEQRSFLIKRVDQQAAAGLAGISRALDERGIVTPDGFDPPAGTPPPPPGDRHFGGPRHRGNPPLVSLPPGTYGERRDAQSHAIGSLTLSYGQKPIPGPRLPGQIAMGRTITVDSIRGEAVRYRVLAMPTIDQDGSTLIAVPLREADQTLSRLLLVEGLVIGGILVLAAVLGAWVVRLGLRPLDRIGETAGAIAAGDLARRVSPAKGRTEVGRLGLALNAMLGQIERAFAERQASEDRLRRFLADASHELRTPLASIRGYAELFRLGAAHRPADTAKAMARIEEESARMGVLVEDLLTLARLDQLPKLARGRVDLSGLAQDAADDAHAVAPEREVELEIDDPATVSGDPSQLRQVVANLVRNALVHTPAGTPIKLRTSRDGAQAKLEVRDNGPGLPADTETLFERFWRADPGRERGKGGAGLGLAIVAAIVKAHGGNVTAANAAGGGALFVVTLPAEPPES